MRINNFYLTIGFCLGLLSCQTKTVEKEVPPQLKITVVNNFGAKIAGAEVSIFEDETALIEKVPIKTIQTDNSGEVLFENLEARNYYFWVEKGNLNNLSSAASFEGVLEKNKIKTIAVTIQ